MQAHFTTKSACIMSDKESKEPTGKSKGGVARANALSAQEKPQQLGGVAMVRWKLPKDLATLSLET